MGESFYINPRRNGSVVILDLMGSVTGTWALELADRLSEIRNSGDHHVILNFKDVPSIDILGIRALKRGLEIGLNTKVILLNSDCREVFGRGGLMNEVEICFSEDDALKRFRLGNTHPSVSERRQSKRIETDYSGEILYRNHRFRGVMRNVSEGGALLGYIDSLGESLQTTEAVRFLFRLRLMGDMEVSGNLVRFHNDGEMKYMGIRFRHSENSRYLIKRICEDPPSSLSAE